MLLLRDNKATADPGVWTASAWLHSDPGEVLHALTVPSAIAQWAPVNFDVHGLSGGRLRAGCRERVSGSIAGIGTTFEVKVMRADNKGLQLLADGPVSLDVTYSFTEHGDGVTVHACVGIRRRRGLTAQVLQAAVAALLNAGALTGALRKLELSLQARPAWGVCAYPQPALAVA